MAFLATIAALAALSLASPTPTIDDPAAEALAPREASASPSPSPVVMVSTRFVQGDTHCAWTDSTSSYAFNQCNGIITSYSVNVESENAEGVITLYSGSACNGTAQSANVAAGYQQTICVTPTNSPSWSSFVFKPSK